MTNIFIVELIEIAYDYFPVLDIVISESSGEIKEFAQFDKVLFAYTTLLRMAKMASLGLKDTASKKPSYQE